MARFIQKADLKALENVLETVMDRLTEAGESGSYAYKADYKAYNYFEEGSNSAEMIDKPCLSV